MDSIFNSHDITVNDDEDKKFSYWELNYHQKKLHKLQDTFLTTTKQEFFFKNDKFFCILKNITRSKFDIKTSKGKNNDNINRFF